MSVEIKKFSTLDAEQCCKIAIENWNQILSRVYNKKIISHFIKQYTIEKFIHSSKKGKIFVAKINSDIVGFIAIKFYDKNTAEIGRMFVSIDYQKRGIGSSLIKFFQDNFADIKKIVVKATDLPSTISFYKKNGFRVEKQLVRVINDAELKEYLMIKNR